MQNLCLHIFGSSFSTDISKCKEDPPMQLDLKSFPRTLMGDRRRRSFKAAWSHVHPWLKYSKQLHSAYCYACRHFSPPNKGGFALHARSERHKQAMAAWRDCQRAAAASATPGSALNKEHNRRIQENREYIKTIGEVLLLTATQNKAQRGRHASADSDDEGNFRAILHTIANHDKAVKKRLTSSHNAKYTSKTIQNEVLDCLADVVRTEITEEVKNSEVFSIIADETKDVKGKEQISLVLRYYYNGAIQESFLHFESAEKLDAAGLSGKIIHILENHGLEYKKNLVGQAYDGASVTSGQHSGVQARIKEEAKYAFYIHCTAHCLNLVLVDAVRAVPEVEEFFYLLEKLSALPAVQRLLQEVAQEGGERSVEARGLLALIDFEFTARLVSLRKVFGETELLSEMLQSPTLDVSKAVDLVEALVQTLKDFRKRQRRVTSLFSFARMFDSNTEDLGHELHQFKRTLERKIQTGMQRPSSTAALVQFIEPYKEVFFELHRLCKIAVAIPVSPASCEQSFSVLKLVKTHLRSTVNDERLSSLAVLSIESRRAKALNLDSFVDRFARNHQNRRIQLL
uniref:TTF-type domain-containing protein n=1 Tax=Salarias fasciatus TaxID=181472 RepID=A0A672I3S2_SALFA